MDATNKVVVGASGFGRECLDTLGAAIGAGESIEMLGVVDDNPLEINLERLRERDVAYLGTISEWIKFRGSESYVLDIGNPKICKKLVEMLEVEGLVPFTLIHPTASVESRSSFEPGTVVCANATISTNVSIGAHVHINSSFTSGHDSVLEDFVSVNPAAVISGEVKINEEVLIGAAATILQQLTIGSGSIIGAATLVTKDIPEGVIVKGVSGRWDS